MKGFTLVEMLVALAALSILAAGGFAVAGVSTNSREIISEKQAETQSLLRLHAALRGDLTQAAERRARNINGVKDQAALTSHQTGDGVFLSVVRRGWDNPMQKQRSSLQYVEYRLRDGRIERMWRRYVDGSPVQEPQLLMTGVERVALEFYDWDQWAPSWRGAPNRPLPRAIRVNMTLANLGDVSQAFLLPAGSTR